MPRTRLYVYREFIICLGVHLFEIIKAIVLGLVQGATEFIPVSSSGHLVIVPWLLGWDHSTLLFDAVVHWGTLVAIILIFWRDFWAMFVAAIQSIVQRSLADSHARLAWFVVLGSVPAAVIGFLFEDRVESLFSSASAPLTAGASLLVTAILLSGSELMTARLQGNKEVPEITLVDALCIGCAQVIALLPGVSRSGSTIAAGLTRGLTREAAARFSFLLGAPIFFGAGLLQLVKALSEDAGNVAAQTPALVVGFLVSAVIGFIAIRFLLAYLRDHSLYAFSIYCFVAGLVVIGLYTSGFHSSGF